MFYTKIHINPTQCGKEMAEIIMMASMKLNEVHRPKKKERNQQEKKEIRFIMKNEAQRQQQCCYLEVEHWLQRLEVLYVGYLKMNGGSWCLR